MPPSSGKVTEYPLKKRDVRYICYQINLNLALTYLEQCRWWLRTLCGFLQSANSCSHENVPSRLWSRFAGLRIQLQRTTDNRLVRALWIRRAIRVSLVSYVYSLQITILTQDSSRSSTSTFHCLCSRSKQCCRNELRDGESSACPRPPSSPVRK